MLSQKSCGNCLGTMLRQVSLIHFTDQLPVPITLYSHLGRFRISHPIYPSLLASFWSTLMASVLFKACSFFRPPPPFFALFSNFLVYISFGKIQYAQETRYAQYTDLLQQASMNCNWISDMAPY